MLAHPAEVALSTLNREGECFAFEGGKGRITVDLPYPVFVSSVAVDFVPSAASTPKVFTVHGYEDKLGRKPTLLGRFEVEVGSIGDGGEGGGEGGRAMNPTVKEFELVDASRGRKSVLFSRSRVRNGFSELV